WMSRQIVRSSSRDDHGVRFWLAPVVQNERQLRANVVSRSERLRQNIGSLTDRTGMRRLLRHLSDDLPVQELEPLLGLKQAELSRAVILVARPAARADPRVRRRRRKG